MFGGILNGVNFGGILNGVNTSLSSLNSGVNSWITTYNSLTIDQKQFLVRASGHITNSILKSSIERLEEARRYSQDFKENTRKWAEQSVHDKRAETEQKNATERTNAEFKTIKIQNDDLAKCKVMCYKKYKILNDALEKMRSNDDPIEFIEEIERHVISAREELDRLFCKHTVNWIFYR
jgi:hypothetical protein